MSSNAVFFLILIIGAAMFVSQTVTYKFDAWFVKNYGDRIISYGWAGACAFAGVAAAVSFGDGDKSRFIVLAVAAVLAVVSMKKCRKRAAEMGADEEMCKKAMWIQFIAPLGIVGLFIVFSLGSSSKKKK